MIRVYVAYAFCCPSYLAEQDIVRFFSNLIHSRAKYFFKAHRPKDYLQEKLILFLLYEKRLPPLIKLKLCKDGCFKRASLS